MFQYFCLFNNYRFDRKMFKSFYSMGLDVTDSVHYVHALYYMTEYTIPVTCKRSRLVVKRRIIGKVDKKLGIG